MTLTLKQFRDDHPIVEEFEESECTICLHPLSGDVRKMPNCTHQFHSTCLIDWLLSGTGCPSCRSLENPVPEDIASRLLREGAVLVQGMTLTEVIRDPTNFIARAIEVAQQLVDAGYRFPVALN